jgi:hypothetical protein
MCGEDEEEEEEEEEDKSRGEGGSLVCELVELVWLMMRIMPARE